MISNDRFHAFRLRFYRGALVRPRGYRIDGEHFSVSDVHGRHADVRIADLAEATDDQVAWYKANEVPCHGTFGDIEWPEEAEAAPQ